MNRILTKISGALVFGAVLWIACYPNGGIDYKRLRMSPIVPSDNFSPSNARTETGALIPSDQFISAERCGACHKETHHQWSESLHRNAARDPFYKESVNILERQRGIEFTRHCESCHAPTALLSGGLTTGSTEPRHLDDEGVTCSVCHSITEARMDGTGSYTVRRPALLVGTDGRATYGDVPDAEIIRNVADHRRAMMSELLRKPEFCAVCHKSAVPPALNNYKFIRGFNAYDEWQMSGASTEAITPYYRSKTRLDCRSCHMPPEGGGRMDPSANDGKVASHRFLGANTATPLFFEQSEQVRKTVEFLQNEVLSLDIFSLRAGERTVAPLTPKSLNRIAFPDDGEFVAEVVVFNRRAAHSFPPELRDLYEPWVEFEVRDETDKIIYHSGYTETDGTLDKKAHVYKSLLLDSFSRPVTRHQVWAVAAKAYDNFIGPGRSDVVRYRFRVPDGTRSFSVRAAVNYRRFIDEYSDFVLGRTGPTKLQIPIVKMAEDALTVLDDPDGSSSQPRTSQSARRWNDYGIGLLEQREDSAASAAFVRASEIDPANPDYLINAAISEMRMERFADGDLAQIKKSEGLIQRALSVDPASVRARFYLAIVIRALGRQGEALRILRDLARLFPQDREVLRQLGQTQVRAGRIRDAAYTFEAIVRIDPTDTGAWQFLEPIYWSLGRIPEAKIAGENYLLWREDPLAESVASQFYRQYPNWADERVRRKVYSANSAERPTLTGAFASPD